MEKDMKIEFEKDFLAHDGMSYEEISELDEKIFRAMRETDIELGALR